MSIYSRQAVVDLALSWLGKRESDGSHKEIIDIYNSHIPLARGTRMQYSWAWCACTWSAIGIKLGYTDIWPLEISVPYLMDRAKEMGIWVESDAYIPKPGDAILYDWADTGKGDNVGSPDHVGVITYVNQKTGYMEVVEGNYSKACKKRTISINGRYIRGFITPRYTDNVVKEDTGSQKANYQNIAREVIAGKWDIGAARVDKLAKAGYDAASVQKLVNDILNTGVNANDSSMIVATEDAKLYKESLVGYYNTTSALYLRNGAGTDRKALVCMPKGVTVSCNGFYELKNGSKWYYVTYQTPKVEYAGFCYSGYLKRKEA